MPHSPFPLWRSNARPPVTDPLLLSSERRRKWRQDATKKVFCDLQMPGGRDTINCQMPALPNSSCIKCPGFAGGVGARRWNWLVHNSLFSLCFCTINPVAHYKYQENMRRKRGTLPVMGLWYVIVTKVIYRLAHKRKCVFRDVRIKTKVSA